MNHARPVQIKFPDCGAACRSQADEIKMIGVPAEMFMPAVMTRMKERNLAAGCWIERVSLVGLETVAPLTGEGQIVFIVRATPALGFAVFGGMQLRGAEVGADAVFAVGLCALSDQSAQFGGDALPTHVARV